jgi:methyl-accepting chemotaxis protein
MKDWTGEPDKDLAGNRVKRFFTDNSVLVRGARVGLGAAAIGLPHRASRADFERTGCDLTDSRQQSQAFMVQTYARDTGAFVTVVTVPIFARGRRWGAGLVGWSEDDKHRG